MQNAHRAKQQAQVEAEQAKVKDEAEWEVSQEIKDAWGISPASTSRHVRFQILYCRCIVKPFGQFKWGILRVVLRAIPLSLVI